MVHPEPEEVDGALCWRVDLGVKSDVVSAASVWLDPQVGYMPRAFVKVFAGTAYTRYYDDYREIAAGQWYPWKSSGSLCPSAGAQDLVDLSYQVQEVSVGDEVKNSRLWFEFPPGVEVDDLRGETASL
jgi:hypothetical protein